VLKQKTAARRRALMVTLSGAARENGESQSSMSLRLAQEHEKCVRHDAFWPFVLCRAGLLRRLRFRLVARGFSEQNIEQRMSNFEVTDADAALLRRSAVLLFDILRFGVFSAFVRGCLAIRLSRSPKPETRSRRYWQYRIEAVTMSFLR
jgi:hypothetical protein